MAASFIGYLLQASTSVLIANTRIWRRCLNNQCAFLHFAGKRDGYVYSTPLAGARTHLPPTRPAVQSDGAMTRAPINVPVPFSSSDRQTLRAESGHGPKSPHSECRDLQASPKMVFPEHMRLVFLPLSCPHTSLVSARSSKRWPWRRRLR